MTPLNSHWFSSCEQVTDSIQTFAASTAPIASKKVDELALAYSLKKCLGLYKERVGKVI